MKRGPKPTPPHTKVLRGSFKLPSDTQKLVQASTGSPPVMPSYLPPEAQEVWREELPRVIPFGVCDLDANIFARYCVLEAHFRRLSMAGETATSALCTELRRLSELLCIGGPKSRLVPIRSTANNPFARNGRRNH